MSLTKVSYSMINGAEVNVLDFGAVGDGVTNDTAAIQAAIAALGTNGGGVYFPAGTYVTDTIVIPTITSNAPHGIIFFGESCSSSILTPLNTNQSIFKGQTSVTPNYINPRSVIRDLGFKPHASGANVACIDMKNMSFSLVENVEFFENGTGRFLYGFRLDDTGGSCYGVVIRGVRLNAFVVAPNNLFYVAGTTTTYLIEDVFVVANTGSDAYPNNIFVAEATTLLGTLRGWVINGLNAVPTISVIQPGDYTKIENCWFESVNFGITDASRTAMHVVVTDCYFNSAPFGGTAGATYSYRNCFDSTNTVSEVFSDQSSGFKFFPKVANVPGGFSLDGYNRQMRGTSITLANDGVAQVTPWSTEALCMLSIVDANAVGCAIFFLQGGNYTVSRVVYSGNYTASAGTASSVNVYWSAANLRYEIQNKTGSQNVFTITALTNL